MPLEPAAAYDDRDRLIARLMITAGVGARQLPPFIDMPLTEHARYMLDAICEGRIHIEAGDRAEAADWFLLVAEHALWMAAQCGGGTLVNGGGAKGDARDPAE